METENNNLNANNKTFLGGQETTAFVNACAMFMLAHHQDVQNKANHFFSCRFHHVL